MQDTHEDLRCPNCGSTNTYETNEVTPGGGTPRHRCRECSRRFTKRTALKEGEEPDILVTYDDDGLGFSISSKKIQSLDELLDAFKVDRNLWEIEKQVVNKWETVGFNTKTYSDPISHTKNTVKTPVKAENFQIKAWLRKKVDIVEWDKFRSDFIKAVKNDSPKIPKIRRTAPRSSYLLNMYEINLYDLHMGKLGWHPETLDGHYDMRIASEIAIEAVEDLLNKVNKYHLDKIMLPWGHDFFNSDIEGTGSATTANGTPQHNDGRWQKMWKMGRELTVIIVEMLKKVAPVEIVMVPGNHDRQKIFYLGDLLEVKYENDQNVTVINEPGTRTYRRYGNTLFGLTHKIGGRDAPTIPRLLQLMPKESESKMDFAETEFHEWHIGHFHHSKKLVTPDYEDHQGIVVRCMRSPSAADAWHAASGYVGAVKGAEAGLYNFELGPQGWFPHNILFDKKD